jgi:alkylation response protein AidB-like acyl-CoA dehydrogenase
MDLQLSDDQTELWAVARRLLDDRAPLTLARQFLDGGGDASALWGQIAELGWYGVGLDPDDPFGVTGLCLLAEQAGRHSAPTLLVDTAVAARCFPRSAGPLSGPLAAGERSAALAVLEVGADWALRDLTTTAEHAGGAFTLRGGKLGAHHGATADAIAVVAQTDGELGVFLVDPGAAGVSVERQSTLDPSCAVARVELEGVVVDEEDACVGPEAARLLADAMTVGTIATAAEAVGAASCALAMAIEYSRERQQFGRPIGSFQALAHLMADLHILRETSWASVLYAAATVDEALDEAPQAAAIAKSHASRATRQIVEGALQVLGGIAFTWEHDVHLLQRRVLECERRFGDSHFHEQRLGTYLAERVAPVPGS